MPALQVRDLPQDLYDDLQIRATKEHRSMAQQTIVALEDHLREKPRKRVAFAKPDYPWSDGTPEEMRERAERKRALFEQIDELNRRQVGPGTTSEEIVQMIRDMREERDDQIMRAIAGSDAMAGGAE